MFWRLALLGNGGKKFHFHFAWREFGSRSSQMERGGHQSQCHVSIRIGRLVFCLASSRCLIYPDRRRAAIATCVISFSVRLIDATCTLCCKSLLSLARACLLVSLENYYCELSRFSFITSGKGLSPVGYSLYLQWIAPGDYLIETIWNYVSHVSSLLNFNVFFFSYPPFHSQPDLYSWHVS